MSSKLRWEWTQEARYRAWAISVQDAPSSFCVEMPLTLGEPCTRLLFSERLDRVIEGWRSIEKTHHNGAFEEWMESLRQSLRRVFLNNDEVDIHGGLLIDLVEVYAHDGACRVMTPVVAVITGGGGTVYLGMLAELEDEDFWTDRLLLRTELDWMENPD